MWCHQMKQLCERRPSFTSERTLGSMSAIGLEVLTYLIVIPGFRLIWSNNQSRPTRWVPETCLMVVMIILNTASLSSSTQRDARWQDMCAFRGTNAMLSVSHLSVFSDVVFLGLSLRVGSRPAAGSNVVYLCLSSSSDDHLLSHSCLGTGMRGGAHNKFCHYPCIFGSFGIPD